MVSTTDELRILKKEKRKLERQFRSSRLGIHRQIYQEKCLAYNIALDKAKTGLLQQQDRRI